MVIEGAMIKSAEDFRADWGVLKNGAEGRAEGRDEDCLISNNHPALNARSDEISFCS